MKYEKGDIVRLIKNVFFPGDGFVYTMGDLAEVEYETNGFIKTNHGKMISTDNVKLFEFDEPPFFDGLIDLSKNERKCECGAHATGSNMHSSWCPLYCDQKEEK